jgi:hypothetical protein
MYCESIAPPHGCRGCSAVRLPGKLPATTTAPMNGAFAYIFASHVPQIYLYNQSLEKHQIE